jgi:hypothetical protein
MGLKVDFNNDLLDNLFYVKSLPSDDNSLCVVCHSDKEPLEGGRMWDRYVLKWGRKYHSRCFRKWRGKNGAVNCSLCGDIDKKEFRYCDMC